MAVQLKGSAQLTPRRDAAAMAEAILRVARNPDEARREALAGREYVCRAWRREKAFDDLRVALEEARVRPA
jgi:glycosyltransferase involved in cell wall biosynthesis